MKILQIVFLLLAETAWGFEQFIMDYFNIARQGRGCEPFRWNPCYGHAAQMHAEQMARYGRLSYNDIETNQPPAFRVGSIFGCPAYNQLAIVETIGWQSNDPLYVANQIERNEGSKMENCHNVEIGIGHALDQYGNYFWAIDLGGY